MLNLHYAYYKRRNETYSCKADHVWQRKVPVLIVHRVIPFAIRRLPLVGYRLTVYLANLIFCSKQNYVIPTYIYNKTINSFPKYHSTY